MSEGTPDRHSVAFSISDAAWTDTSIDELASIVSQYFRIMHDDHGTRMTCELPRCTTRRANGCGS
jgi:hypothetical protein